MTQIVHHPFSVLLLMTAVAVLLLAAQVGRRIPSPGTRSMTTLLGLCAFWLTSDACLHLYPDHEYLLTRISYIPTALAPALLLILALEYRSRYEYLTIWSIAGILAIPLATILVAITDQHHHWLWSQFDTTRVNGLVHMQVLYGPWFYIHIGYSYLMNVAAAALLLQTVMRSSALHRGQTVTVMLSMLLPWLANAVYLFRLPPTRALDLTSAAFAGSCILLALGIVLYRLFDVVPVAREHVLQHMRDCVLVVDAEGRLLDVNPAAEAAFGINCGHAGRVVHLRFRTAAGEWRSVRDFQTAGTEEVEWEEAGEPARYFDLTVSPLRIKGRKLAGCTLVLRDVTARRLEQEALLRSREELRSALQRVEALAGEAESANRVKSEFLAAMSHEIRTPLNAVLGAADVLEDTDLSDSQREFTSMIRSAGSTLLSIINDILDLSKVEAGQMELADEPFSVLTVIDQVNELVEEQTFHKQLLLEVDLAEDFQPWVRGDVSRFRQVLLNLVSNAVKFTDAGSVTVRARRTDELGWLRVEVEDTGIGVPSDSRLRLFEVFRQADPSMARRFGGTGLGLAIARRLVEIMGGRIGYQPATPQGSLFWFEVPVAPEDAPPSASRPTLRGAALIVASPATARLLHLQLRSLGISSTSCSTAEEAQSRLRPGDLLFVEHSSSPDNRGAIHVTTGGKTNYVRLDRPVRLAQLMSRLSMLAPELSVDSNRSGSADAAPAWAGRRVLVAEDNAVNARLAQALLKRAGLTVELVHNGEDALMAYQAGRWDLILMDLQMPGMDGLEATQRIREWEREQRAPRTPICALTANVLSGERGECAAAGMDDFLAKPLERREILRVLERWLARGR